MSEVMVLKRKFSVGMICILAITTLLFVGCSNDSKGSSNLKGVSNAQKTSTNVAPGSNSIIDKEAKNTRDRDLITSAGEDSPIQLDSLETEAQGLSSEEIDSLLNDNSELNNIPTNFNVK
jgi:hypothetical protein